MIPDIKEKSSWLYKVTPDLGAMFGTGETLCRIVYLLSFVNGYLIHRGRLIWVTCGINDVKYYLIQTITVYVCFLPCANFPPKVRHCLAVVDDSYSS